MKLPNTMQNIIAITQTKINGTEINSVNSREIYEYLKLADGQYSRWINTSSYSKR